MNCGRSGGERESARAQPERVTNCAFAVEAKQPLSKHGTQSSACNQQQPVLRANSYTTSHRVQCIGFKGAHVATRENSLQLLYGGLKRVQECGSRYQVTDELFEILFEISSPTFNYCRRVHNNKLFINILHFLTINFLFYKLK
jgi:hypothetical protein